MVFPGFFFQVFRESSVYGLTVDGTIVAAGRDFATVASV